jgi:hypothetical protein
MKRNYKIPDKEDWTFQLSQVEMVLKEVRKAKIAINSEMINLKVREIQGENLGTEISACHRKELENRMGELALLEQKKKLEEFIYKE